MDASQQERVEIHKTSPPDKGLLQKFIGVLQKIGEGLDTRTKRYSLEEMGRPEVVAQVILGTMGNPLLERVGRDRWENSFSLVTLLSNMGHPPIITSQDYFKNLLGEAKDRYLALRQTLRQLSAGETDPQEVKTTKPLFEYQLEEPDAYGETFHYKVVNEALLRKLATAQIP